MECGLAKVRKVESCSLPTLRYLKFNVDGAARGNPSLAGIRGVLHNSRGFFFFQTFRG